MNASYSQCREGRYTAVYTGAGITVAVLQFSLPPGYRVTLPSLVLNWIVVGKLENLYSNLSSLSSSLLLNQQCFTTGSTMIKWDRRSCTFWIDKVKFGQIGLFHQQLVSLLSPSLSLSPSLIYFHLHIIHFPSQWSKTRRKSARTVKRKLSTYWSLQHPKILILQYEFHMKLLFQSIAI